MHGWVEPDLGQWQLYNAAFNHPTKWVNDGLPCLEDSVNPNFKHPILVLTVGARLPLALVEGVLDLYASYDIIITEDIEDI